MKKTLNMLLLVLLVVLGCSVTNAQIIYSNDFTTGGSGNITNATLTVANNYAGGVSGAAWYDTIGANDPGDLQANGIDNTPLTTSWVLPFTPQTGFIYLMTTVVAFTNNPASGAWIGAGFAGVYTNNESAGNGRFADAVAGYDFAILTESSGNVQYFSGPKATSPSVQIFSGSGTGVGFTPGPGTNTMQLVLNTKSATTWTMSCYVNGLQMGTTNFPYPNPSITTNIHAIGLTQTALTASPANPSAVQYLNFSLVTTLAPFISQEPTPASLIIGGGSRYTNIVQVTADAGGGTLAYQWYANGMPLTNGVNNVSGANTNLLVINPIQSVNMFTNYYVIVTNNYGSATSSLASVTVLTNPVVAFPKTLNNPITLLSGSGGTIGSSPSFVVTAIGAPPLQYFWSTNGVAVGGQTNNTFSYTNCQSASSPSTYACIVSNSFSTVTSTWSATYLPAPTATYPQAVLGDQPFDFWRLNETNSGIGTLCDDYGSGNNGIYTNVTLAQAGYDASEPSQPSMAVTSGGTQPSCVKLIVNSDLAVTRPSGVSATFSVEAWANCSGANGASGGAPVVSQGLFQSSSFFLGVDTNNSIFTQRYQFYVRGANGTLYSADDTNSAHAAIDFTWHHLVGVCDQVHGLVQLYIDGILTAQTTIPAGAGLFESGLPVAIGAGIRPGATDYNVPFSGNISDVAIYPTALSVSQVVAHYSTVSSTVPLTFATVVPPTNFSYQANQTLSIPVTVAGSGTIGYYWTNLTTGGAAISSGFTNVGGPLNVSLSIPNAPSSLSGDQIELVVTNPVSSTNVIFALFNPPPTVVVDPSSPILYSNIFYGGTWSIQNMGPTVANALVGGTNSVFSDLLGTNNPGALQANGISTTTFGDSWLLPFIPHPGYIYTINASLTFFGNPSSWTGPGFGSAYVNTNTANATQSGANHARFTDDVCKGYDWTALTESSSNLQYFAGPQTSVTIVSSNAWFTPNLGTHSIQVILNTTGAVWTCYSVVDGRVSPTTNFPATNLPTIGAVGITQTAITAPTNYQYNFIALSQVAPAGGAAPYSVTNLPTAVTLLANSPLAYTPTIFGNGPYGYYWMVTNTGAILASGTTNGTGFVTGSVSVGSVASSQTLALVMTNSYGTNISYIAVTITNVVTVKPAITGFNIAANGNVTINATNGQTGGTYYLLGTTNLATPLGQWLPLSTNVITTNGTATAGFTFTGTNVVNGKPQQFYILSNTN